MWILVLDDELPIGRLVERVAKKLGIDAEIVVSVSEFGRSYDARIPDAIVLDLHISENDGIEQLKFLSDRGYGKPIVLMSGLDDRLLNAARQVGEGLGLQIAGILPKPIRMADLSALLSRLQTKIWSPSPAELRNAIKANDLVLDLQPVIDGKSKNVVGAEALVRWSHPEHGRIPPDRFILLAETHCDLISDLTMWVIREAGRHHQVLADAGFPIPIAVNLSGKNLKDTEFPNHVQDVLQELDLTSAALSFELTETAAFDGLLQTLDILSRLRIKGFDLAIDDFGIGYSSLKTLRQLPFSTIKVDRSFVADMAHSRDAHVIVKSVIDLASNMGLSSVAEGVETEEIASELTKLGVGAMQGYLFCRPVPVKQLCAWLSHQALAPASRSQIRKGSDFAVYLSGSQSAH